MIDRTMARRLARALADELAFTAQERTVGEIRMRRTTGTMTPASAEDFDGVVWRALEVCQLAADPEPACICDRPPIAVRVNDVAWDPLCPLHRTGARERA